MSIISIEQYLEEQEGRKPLHHHRTEEAIRRWNFLLTKERAVARALFCIERFGDAQAANDPRIVDLIPPPIFVDLVWQLRMKNNGEDLLVALMSCPTVTLTGRLP